MKTIFLFLAFVAIVCGDLTIDLIKDAGYPVEVHQVYTEDDYQVRLQRIPGKAGGRRESVIMVHGLWTNGAQWVLQPKHQSLAFMLHDAGFDVWLFNARGTKFSLYHKTLSPDSREYWDWTWHEVAVKDLPASITTIQRVTGGNTIRMVAHSQGCTSALVLLSELPEYNKIVKSTYLLSPAIFINGADSIASLAAPFGSLIYQLLDDLNVFAIVPGTPIQRMIMDHLCLTPLNQTCKELLPLAIGAGDGEKDMDEFLRKWPKYVFDASSVKEILHFGQVMTTGKFRKFDFGSKKLNEKHYGQSSPPFYNLKAITSPIYVYYGTKDGLVPTRGAEKLIKMLPNVKKSVALPYDHADLLYSKYVDTKINRPIVDSMIADSKGK